MNIFHQARFMTPETPDLLLDMLETDAGMGHYPEVIFLHIISLLNPGILATPRVMALEAVLATS